MKIYTTASSFNCGPCSFINLTGIKANKKIENELSKTGRLKPFQVTVYTAFLIWAEKYKKNILIYTASKKLNNRLFNLMISYEKIPQNLQKDYKKRAKEQFNHLNTKFSKIIKPLKNPIKKLDELLKKDYRVAVLSNSFYFDKNPVPHWIVAYKKDKTSYYFMCSKKGQIKLTKKQVIIGFKLNKKLGFYPALVAYKQ
jgi:hypothetical protein